MKVIHLIDSGGYFGAERVLITLALEQQKHGYDISIVSCGGVGQNEKPFEYECKKAGLNLFVWRGKTLINLYQLLKRNPQAIFHSHGYKFNILLVLLNLCFRGSIKVATVHGYTTAPIFSKLNCYYLLNKFALKLLSGAVFVSHKTVQDSAAALNEKNIVIYNGIADLPAPLLADDIDNTFVDKAYLIGVGRLSAEKAFNDLISAFHNVSKKHPEISLLIVGNGNELANLKRLALANDRIHFLGHKENPLSLIAHARLLVISSVSEGLPIVLLEAMRSGTDIVSSRVGAIPDVIEDGVTGLLYDAGDVRQLVQSINDALALEKGTLGSLARNRFAKEFTSEKMFLQYHAWYEYLAR